ncbi:MAG: hypothetical protein K0M45_01920 [Candidatus Paracaedibacteraceae bacterium]|nr:hypothetical protein [Candidatus Paracaedibacteraceae bacterium]
MKLELLKTGLAEIVEDNGYTVCDQAILARLLRPLQGYIDGINIDGVYIQHGDSLVPQIDAKQFSLRFNNVLTNYIESLAEDHPLKLLVISGELYPNVSSRKLENLLIEIKENWVEAAQTHFGHNKGDLHNTLDGIEQTVRSYIDLLQNAEVNSDLDVFREDLNSGTEEVLHAN